MNYANMIEEKNLKKTFIIATLCSTLIGTFTSSMGLWDRVKDKRDQTKRDTEQDKEIKELRKQVEDAGKQQQQQNNNNNNNNNQQNQHQHQIQQRCCSGSRHRSPPPRRRGREDEVGYALERSGALIGREFDEGYERLGRRFAIGDTVTENRLQAQIIALQQTVITVLQDALYNGRQLDNADMSKLIAASNAAREGSLDALRQQRQRQTLAIEAPAPAPAVPMPPPAVSFASPRRAKTVLSEPEPLYCRYSLDLQHVRNKPLARTFAPGGDCRCPGCGIRLQAEADDFWEIGKRARGRPAREGRRGSSSSEAVLLDEREFHVGQRFVVKCHTPDGEFACVLCSRFRDQDVICPTVDQLINHVGRDHTVDELEREDDFEMRARARPLRKALMAP
ncbi:hypothetical protein PG996_008685 [Apiospora saccharicola]|uniref:Uncharacterized protein n=1 Tax=Apiospora saccharicola TaxID=335842 RepID=A0ABR1UYM3_9PEZI